MGVGVGLGMGLGMGCERQSDLMDWSVVPYAIVQFDLVIRSELHAVELHILI